MTIYYPPLVNGLQKQLDAQLDEATVDQMTLNNATNVQNKPGVVVIDRIDADGNEKSSSLREYISYTGTSGSTLTGLTRGVGGSTDQDHAVGAIVEFIPDVVWAQALINALLKVYNETNDTLLKATGAEINTGTEDAKIVTPKAIKDANMPYAGEATGAEINTGTATTKYNSPKAIADSYLSNVYNSMARQAIINGNFDVWQRGTSIAMTTANAYSADRWYAETATAGTDKTISQQDGTGVEGSQYCARVAMVQDVDELLTFSQALESQDSIKLRGKKLTLSFYARGGAEFVADNATLVSKIVTGKGTDQKVLAFTTSADGVSQNNTLTTGWQKFTCTTTAAIASDITQIGISFAFTHAGSGTTTNYFEVAQVQLCAGDVALPFMPKSFKDELRACKRYYQIFSGLTLPSFIGMVWDSEGYPVVTIPLSTQMRTTPTISSGTWRMMKTTASGSGSIVETTTSPTVNYTNYSAIVCLSWSELGSGLPAFTSMVLWGGFTLSAEL